MDISDFIHRMRVGLQSQTPNVFPGVGGGHVPVGLTRLPEASSGLSRLLGPAAMAATQGDVLNNFAHSGPAVPSGSVQAGAMPAVVPPGPAPQAPFSQPSAPTPPPAPAAPASPQLPWWASGDMTQMFPGASPQPQPQPSAPQAPTVNPNGSIPGAMGPTSVGGAPLVNQPQNAPMPMARPADAPQSQPDTSFFMRNALMMHDPATGGLIDPSGAASVRGPDLINKMMTYLHGKANT